MLPLNYKTTIADIARELNLASATVSRALNNHPAISAGTRKTILETADRLNYRKPGIKAILPQKRKGVIGVMIPSTEINFFGAVLRGIETMASRDNYNIIIAQSNESRLNEVRGVETLLTAGVEGILVSMAKNTNDYTHFLELKKANLPVVFFDRANEDLGIHAVVVNDHKGAFHATRHLADQGYQRIAHVSGPQHIKAFKDRYRGYLSALHACGHGIDPDLVFEGSVSVDAGKAAVQYFLQMEQPPDAIFAVDDFTALGVVQALKEQGINCPAEMGVIGFGNEKFGEHLTPALSTVDQRTSLMGVESYKLLMQLVRNQNVYNSEQKVVLDPVPVFRASSCRYQAGSSSMSA